LDFPGHECPTGRIARLIAELRNAASHVDNTYESFGSPSIVHGLSLSLGRREFRNRRNRRKTGVPADATTARLNMLRSGALNDRTPRPIDDSGTDATLVGRKTADAPLPSGNSDAPSHRTITDITDLPKAP
jgi:hypothetical protein